jgi:hypothetical protein
MPRIFYLCHDNPKPSGGVRTVYHHVYHLVQSGFDATVVHFKPEFKIEWFSNEVPVTDGSRDFDVMPQDWIVVPDDLMAALEAFRRVCCHKAVLCQGHFHTFHHLPTEKSWWDYGVEKILVTSTEIQNFVRHVFKIKGVYIPLAIDHNLFYPDPAIRRLQIAYMPRKGSWNIRLVRGMLWHRRPDLRSIPWIPIDNMSEKEVARTLQQSSHFISTSFREGFGLPPVEAMACGCLVVGFAGGGGREYATNKNGFWVPDEDAMALAQTLEAVLSEGGKHPQKPEFEEIRRQALETARQYSFQQQEERLVDFWSKTLTHQEISVYSSVKSPAVQDLQPDWFEKNLEILIERYPSLAEKIRDIPLCDDAFVEQSVDGLPILRIVTGEKQEVPLYSRLNPRHKISNDLKELTFKAEDATLFLGFGLGYHIEEIVRLMEVDHQVIVVEPSMGLFRLALGCRDLKEFFTNDRIHLVVGKDLGELHQILEYHLMRIVAGHLNEITLKPLQVAFPKMYADADDRIQKILLNLKLSYRQCMERQPLLSNVLNNATSLSTALDARSLSGLLAGKPAIVVSGGPSLGKNLGLLRRAEGKACIIAVDTALQPLLTQGTKPDFVVSLDPAEQNYRKIDGLPKPLDIPLVYEPGVYFKIPQHFGGYRFVSRGLNSLSHWLLNRGGFGKRLGKAISAAHLAFFLARAMEADPIIFVGLDLSFPDERHHVEGAPFVWAPNPDQEYQLVPDVSGGMVKTIPGFQAMIGLFEAEIIKTRARCIDATEGGALIEGTKVMSLASVLKRYVSQSQIDVKEKLQSIRRPSSSDVRKKTSDSLSWILEEAQSISDLGQQALPLIGQAIDMVDGDAYRDKKFSELATEIQALDQALARRGEFNDIMIDFQAELLIYQFLQGYKIKRAADPRSSLRLSLESIERAFHDLKELADDVISIIQNISSQQGCAELFEISSRASCGQGFC